MSQGDLLGVLKDSRPFMPLLTQLDITYQVADAMDYLANVLWVCVGKYNYTHCCIYGSWHQMWKHPIRTFTMHAYYNPHLLLYQLIHVYIAGYIVYIAGVYNNIHVH